MASRNLKAGAPLGHVHTCSRSARWYCRHWPVGQEGITGEGQQQQEHGQTQLEPLILVFVGKSLFQRQWKKQTFTLDLQERCKRWLTCTVICYLDCLLRRVTFTFPRIRRRYSLQHQTLVLQLHSHFTGIDRRFDMGVGFEKGHYPFFLGRKVSISAKALGCAFTFPVIWSSFLASSPEDPGSHLMGKKTHKVIRTRKYGLDVSASSQSCSGNTHKCLHPPSWYLTFTLLFQQLVHLLQLFALNGNGGGAFVL